MSRLWIAVGTCSLLLTLGTRSHAQHLNVEPLRLGGEPLASNTLDVEPPSLATPAPLPKSSVPAPRTASWQEDDLVNWFIVGVLFVGFAFGLAVTVSSVRSNAPQPIRLL